MTPAPAAVPPTEEAVRQALARFVGTIEQVPPAYSALKVDGRRAHALARSGDAVSLAPRPVRVEAVRLVSYDWPFADVEVDCGKGTYIRSIARDVGAALGVGGMVETLRRTRVGPFTADGGIGIDAPAEDGRARLLPMATVFAGVSGVSLDEDGVRRFRYGQVVPVAAEVGDRVPVFGPTNELIGLGEVRERRVKPLLVLG